MFNGLPNYLKTSVSLSLHLCVPFSIIYPSTIQFDLHMIGI